MSLQDSFTLGQCYRDRKGKDFLAEFEKARIPQTSQEVIRMTGLIRMCSPYICNFAHCVYLLSIEAVQNYHCLDEHFAMGLPEHSGLL